MTQLQKTKSKPFHSDEFKAEALGLAEQIGVPKAAKELGIHASQLYQWRKNSKHAKTVTERESALEVEVVRLRRELAQYKEEVAILKKASAYFAKQLK